MTDDKVKKPLEVLELGEGLVCDPDTGICEIPGASGPSKPGIEPLPVDKAKAKEEAANGD